MRCNFIFPQINIYLLKREFSYSYTLIIIDTCHWTSLFGTVWYIHACIQHVKTWLIIHPSPETLIICVENIQKPTCYVETHSCSQLLHCCRPLQVPVSAQLQPCAPSPAILGSPPHSRWESLFYSPLVGDQLRKLSHTTANIQWFPFNVKVFHLAQCPPGSSVRLRMTCNHMLLFHSSNNLASRLTPHLCYCEQCCNKHRYFPNKLIYFPLNT